MTINDPRDRTWLAVKHQGSENSKIPIGVNRAVWPCATGYDRIPTLNWNPDDEPVDALTAALKEDLS